MRLLSQYTPTKINSFDHHSRKQMRFGIENAKVWLPTFYFPYTTPKNTPVQNPGMLKQLVDCVALTQTPHAVVLPATPELVEGSKRIDTVTVQGFQDPISVDVFYKKQPQPNGNDTDIYTLHHETLLNQPHYTDSLPEKYPFLKQFNHKSRIAGEAQKVLFDRAHKQFLDKQLQQSLTKNPKLHHIIMPHNWEATPSSYELRQKYPRTAVIQFQHDVYRSDGIPQNSTEQINLSPFKLHPNLFNKEGTLSIAALAHKYSDGLFANTHHVKNLIEEYEYHKDEELSSALKQLQNESRIYPIHHALASKKLPHTTPFLTKGFEPLKAKTLTEIDTEALQNFKARNKKALLEKYFPNTQRKNNTDTPVISFTARFVIAKNALASYLTLKNLLAEFPDLHVIMCGSLRWGMSGTFWRKKLEELASQYPNRFKYLGMQDEQGVMEVLSGSDLNMHPSSGEPFGVATLEAMGMGNVLITLPSSANKNITTKLKNHCISGYEPNIDERIRLKQEGMDAENIQKIGPETQKLTEELTKKIGLYLREVYPHKEKHLQNQLAGITYVQKYHSPEHIASLFEEGFKKIKEQQK